MTTNAIKPLPPMPLPIHIEGMEQHKFTRFCLDSDYLALRSYTEDCLARLRVAVGVLSYAATTAHASRSIDDDVMALDNITSKIDDALAAIGPLPPTERSKDTI